MCSELQEEGKPELPSYGMGEHKPESSSSRPDPQLRHSAELRVDSPARYCATGWFKMRCQPDRKSYRNWHTLVLEQNSGDDRPCGFCLFSRETMAAKGKGKKRRRTAFMVC